MWELPLWIDYQTWVNIMFLHLFLPVVFVVYARYTYVKNMKNSERSIRDLDIENTRWAFVITLWLFSNMCIYFTFAFFKVETSLISLILEQQVTLFWSIKILNQLAQLYSMVFWFIIYNMLMLFPISFIGFGMSVKWIQSFVKNWKINIKDLMKD